MIKVNHLHIHHETHLHGSIMTPMSSSTFSFNFSISHDGISSSINSSSIFMTTTITPPSRWHLPPHIFLYLFIHHHLYHHPHDHLYLKHAFQKLIFTVNLPEIFG